MNTGNSISTSISISLRNAALTAGIGYLVIFITGIFANFFILEGLVINGNAAATFENISSNEFQFRVGIFAFIIMVISDVVLAWALYVLLIPVNRALSLLSGWLRLINASIFSIALFNLVSILPLVNNTGTTYLPDTGWLQIQVMLYIGAFNYTWLIGLVFFGIHLPLLGYLVIKSGYIPKILGILLFIAGIGYLTDSFAQFLLEDYARYANIFSMVVIIPGVIGELSFTLWLLIRGRKIPLLK